MTIFVDSFDHCFHLPALGLIKPLVHVHRRRAADAVGVRDQTGVLMVFYSSKDYPAVLRPVAWLPITRQ